MSPEAAVDVVRASLTPRHGPVSVPHLQGHQVLRLLQIGERHRYRRYDSRNPLTERRIHNSVIITYFMTDLLS